MVALKIRKVLAQIAGHSCVWLILDSQSSALGYREWPFVPLSWILLINIILVRIKISW